MSDVEDLRRHERRRPPSGALEVVVARGRRRRRRTCWGASLSTVAVVGMAVALSTGADGRTPVGLEFTDLPSTAPSAERTPAPELSTSSLIRTPQPGRGTVESSAVVSGPEDLAPERPSSSPSARPRPAPSTLASDMRRQTVAFDPGECQGSGAGRESTGWCTRYAGATTSRRGKPVDLVYELCRLAPTSGTVTFATTKEIDVSVRQPGANLMVWRWSTGRRFVDRKSATTVLPSTCLRWTTTWRTLDQLGRLPATGNYVINFDFNFAFGESSPSVYVNVKPDRDFVITE